MGGPAKGVHDIARALDLVRPLPEIGPVVVGFLVEEKLRARVHGDLRIVEVIYSGPLKSPSSSWLVW